MNNTVITSTWLNPVRWINGWNVLRGDDEIKQPSIWVIDSAAAHSRLADQYEPLLSTEEMTRGNRFLQAAHVIRYKAAHTALRLLLTRSTSSDPSAIRFANGYHHKPLLSVPPDSPIGFNLSYSENNAMIGLAYGYPIGIDIEWLQRPMDVNDMLSACFSDREITFITSSTEHVYHRFFTLWTRKEAILKLTGEGIGEHLPLFEVLDGVNVTEKKIIGRQPPSAVYLYSFAIGEGFLGCFAAPLPIEELFFYRL